MGSDPIGCGRLGVCVEAPQSKEVGGNGERCKEESVCISI